VEKVAWERVQPQEDQPPGQLGSRRSSHRQKSTDEKGEAEAASAKKLAWEKVEKIHMFARPWLRVDASLNRKIFDRLLGAILGYVMQKPGQPLSNTADRFAPAIQPYHTRELLEILQEMRCLDLVKISKPTCSLFKRKSVPVHDTAPATMLDDAGDIIVEPTVDAIVILGQFIGEKQYSSDIYQCPCHPKNLI